MAAGTYSFRTRADIPNITESPFAIRDSNNKVSLFVFKGNYDGFYLTKNVNSYTTKFPNNIFETSGNYGTTTNIFYYSPPTRVVANDSVGTFASTNLRTMTNVFYLGNIPDNSFYLVPVGLNIDNNLTFGNPMAITVKTFSSTAPGYYLTLYAFAGLENVMKGNVPNFLLSYNYPYEDKLGSFYGLDSTNNTFNTSTSTNLITKSVQVYDSVNRIYRTSTGLSINNRVGSSIINGIAYAFAAPNLYLSAVIFTEQEFAPRPVVTNVAMDYNVRRPSNKLLTNNTFFDKYLLFTSQKPSLVGLLTDNISSYTDAFSLVTPTLPTTLYAYPYATNTVTGGLIYSFASSQITLTYNPFVIDGLGGIVTFTNIHFNRVTLNIANFDYQQIAGTSSLKAGDIIRVFDITQSIVYAEFKVPSNGMQNVSILIPNLTAFTSYVFCIKLTRSNIVLGDSIFTNVVTTLYGLIIPLQNLTLTNGPNRGDVTISILRNASTTFEDAILDTSDSLAINFNNTGYFFKYNNSTNTYSVVVPYLRANTTFNTISAVYFDLPGGYQSSCPLVKSITTPIQTDEAIIGLPTITFYNTVTTINIEAFDYWDANNLSIVEEFGGDILLYNASNTLLETYTGVIVPGESTPKNIKLDIYNLGYQVTYSGFYIKCRYKTSIIGPKILNIPTFTTPKLFEFSPQIYPIMHIAKISIPVTENFYSIPLSTLKQQLRIQLIRPNSTVESQVDVNYPTTGNTYDFIFRNITPGIAYTARYFCKLPDETYVTDPSATYYPTVTTLSDILNVTLDLSLNFQDNYATISFLNVKLGTQTPDINGIIELRGSALNIVSVRQSSSSVTFDTIPNLSSTSIYRYTSRLRPAISLQTGIEDYSLDYKVPSFIGKAGFWGTVTKTVLPTNGNDVIITVKVTDMTVGGLPITDGRTIVLWDNVRGQLSSQNALNQTVEYSFRMKEKLFYLQDLIEGLNINCLLTDPYTDSGGIYHQYENGDLGTGPIYLSVSADIQTSNLVGSNAYATYWPGNGFWKLSYFANSVYSFNGIIKVSNPSSDVINLTKPGDFDSQVSSFKFPYSETRTGYAALGSQSISRDIYPVVTYDIDPQSGDPGPYYWDWGYFESGYGEPQFLYSVPNTIAKENRIRSTRPLPSDNYADGYLIYYTYTGYSKPYGGGNTQITIRNLRWGDTEVEEDQLFQIYNKDQTPLIINGSNITGNYISSGVTITLANTSIPDDDTYRLYLCPNNNSFYKSYNWQYIPKNGTSNRPLVPNMKRQPLPLILSNSCRTLVYKEKFSHYYIANSNNSYISQFYNILTLPVEFNTTNRQTSIIQVSTRKIELSKNISSVLFSIPVNINSTWTAFGNHLPFSVRTIDLNAPAFYLTNANVSNTITLNTPLTDLETYDSAPFYDINGSDGSSLGNNLFIKIVNNQKTIQLNRTSLTPVHNITQVPVIISYNTLFSDRQNDILNIYTTVATEYPYRPGVVAFSSYSINVNSSKTITFGDPTVITQYPQFLAFATKEDAMRYLNTNTAT